MSDNIWRILGWITAGGFVFIAVFLIWVYIESEIYARHLRKMKDESDKKRSIGPLEAGYRERIKRAAEKYAQNEP
jgi:hypothetical protein